QCGRPGHTRRTCDGSPVTAKKPTSQNHIKVRQPCSECGSIGTRHFKTCSKATAIQAYSRGQTNPENSKHTRTILDEPVRLTEEEYNEVCESLNDGLTIEMVGFN